MDFCAWSNIKPDLIEESDTLHNVDCNPSVLVRFQHGQHSVISSGEYHSCGYCQKSRCMRCR
jgi:hypothetical protein